MKNFSHKIPTLIASGLLLISTYGHCGEQNAVQDSTLIEKVITLKPSSVEANASIVKGPTNESGEGGNLDPNIKTIEVVGYANRSVDIASYLKAITDNNIGKIKISEIRPSVHDGRRLYNFVFQILVSPIITTEISADEIANKFLRVYLHEHEAWFLNMEFYPFGQTIRGLPIRRIDATWCMANEFTKELFPSELYAGDLGLDAIFQDGGSFSLTNKYDGVRKLSVLVGVYKTCDGITGTFLLALNERKPGKPVVFLQQYKKQFFAYLQVIDQHSFALRDCYACDGSEIYEWDKTSNTFAMSGSDE